MSTSREFSGSAKFLLILLGFLALWTLVSNAVDKADSERRFKTLEQKSEK